MRRALVLAGVVWMVLGGCRGGAAPVSDPVVPRADGFASRPGASRAGARDPSALPALYRPLFEEGRTFSYRVDYRLEQAHGAAEGVPRVGCRVEAVVRLPEAVAAVVACDSTGLEYDETPRGTWVATDAGLFLTERLPADASDLGTLALVPVVSADPARPVPPGAADTTAHVSGDRVCVRHTLPDELGAWTEHCFEPGRGVVALRWAADDAPDADRGEIRLEH